MPQAQSARALSDAASSVSDDGVADAAAALAAAGSGKPIRLRHHRGRLRSRISFRAAAATADGKLRAAPHGLYRLDVEAAAAGTAHRLCRRRARRHPPDGERDRHRRPPRQCADGIGGGGTDRVRANCIAIRARRCRSISNGATPSRSFCEKISPTSSTSKCPTAAWRSGSHFGDPAVLDAIERDVHAAAACVSCRRDHSRSRRSSRGDFASATPASTPTRPPKPCAGSANWPLRGRAERRTEE